MEEQGIDLWITFTREGNEDPLAQDPTVLRPNLALSCDYGPRWKEDSHRRKPRSGNYQAEEVLDAVIGYESEAAAPKLRQFVSKRRPKKIAVNTSYDEGAADGLTSSMERYLRRALKDYARRLVSAEDLAIALRARLIPEEVELVKKSIAECEKIYDAAEDMIRPGKKDRDVHDFMHKLVGEKDLATAWCMTVAPQWSLGAIPRGHVGYYDDIIEEGDLVKLDFGVSYQGYCSDIQRVYFVGSGNVPRGVKDMFATAREANDAALSVLKPGVAGYLVDQAGRRLIVKRGYPEYKHALGHALGRSTHEIGPLLGPKWPKGMGSR